MPCPTGCPKTRSRPMSPRKDRQSAEIHIFRCAAEKSRIGGNAISSFKMRKSWGKSRPAIRVNGRHGSERTVDERSGGIDVSRLLYGTPLTRRTEDFAATTPTLNERRERHVHEAGSHEQQQHRRAHDSIASRRNVAVVSAEEFGHLFSERVASSARVAGRIM